MQHVAAADVAEHHDHAALRRVGAAHPRGDGVRAVHRRRHRRAGDRRYARQVGEDQPVPHRPGAWHPGPDRESPVVQRQHVVAGRLDPELLDETPQHLRVLGGEVPALGRVLVDPVQLPAVLVPRGAALVERDSLPALVVDAAVAEHLEVLAVPRRRRRRVAQPVAEAAAVQRHLRYAPAHRGRLHPDQVEHRRGDVDAVLELRPHLPAGHVTGRPAQHERHPDPALVGVLLVAAERGVADLRPAQRVVALRPRAADLVDPVQAVLEVLRHPVLEGGGVERAERRALGARPVVRHDHEDRVVEAADPLQEVDQAPELGVGVVDHRRVRLLHAGEQAPLLRRHVVPRHDAGVVRWQRRVRRDDAQPDLPPVPVRADDVPARCRSGPGTSPGTPAGPGAARAPRRTPDRGRTASPG